jgi:hypothetical protein
MKVSRRNFLTSVSLSGLGMLMPSFGSALRSLPEKQLKLDINFINLVKGKIEQEILPAMEKIYLNCGVTFNDDYRPELKYLEKIVGFYDYQACGISVLAILALQGNERAKVLIRRVLENSQYYCQNIYGNDVQGSKWDTPLRRLLLHLALAYKTLEPTLRAEEKEVYRKLVEQQIPLALKWNKDFFPGKGYLYMSTNNHNAIFMQGIIYCGKIFKHKEWVDTTLNFARRMYDSVNPDGYFEEASNKERESGPSLVYTRLTLGCLYDVLDGKIKSQEKFIRAGNFYRSFINYDYRMIPIADERTNSSGKGIDFGLALHSLTFRGRYFIVDNLTNLDYSELTVEDLAVIYHELNLMRLGICNLPENRTEGNSRITLPLGIVRKNGFTAGLSALLALNRTLHPKNDYHLDHQDMVYLSHQKAGIILTGYKSKNNPGFSTFRIGEDAYTIKTGVLAMGKGWAEATLHYKFFTAKIRWEISDSARLTLTTDSDHTVTTSLPVTDEKYIKSDKNFQIKYLKGFSPYTQNNEEGKIKTAVFEWEKKLIVDFKV